MNYGYGFLEAESRVAISSIGLEPAVGFLHDFSDYQTKASLAYDLQEPFRWLVDLSVVQAFESGVLHVHKFYFTGDDYGNRFKVESEERFIALLRDHFNAGMVWKGQRLKRDTVIEQKTNELSRFLIGKKQSVEFMEPELQLEREDNRELRAKILALTAPEARRLGIGKSTLHYLRCHARNSRPFRVNRNVKEQLDLAA